MSLYRCLHPKARVLLTTMTMTIISMSLKTPNCIFVNIENFSDTEYIDNIDSQLQNLPKEIYISKLLELFSANESKALWYRSVLYSRDSAHQEDL